MIYNLFLKWNKALVNWSDNGKTSFIQFAIYENYFHFLFFIWYEADISTALTSKKIKL